jgi:hypothetical protein
MSNTTKWTPEMVLQHLAETFTLVGKQFPALLEPYEILLADAHDDADRVEIMRRGLRETIRQRYPMHTQAAAE